jgi:hypothetical protein
MINYMRSSTFFATARNSIKTCNKTSKDANIHFTILKSNAYLLKQGRIIKKTQIQVAKTSVWNKLTDSSSSSIFFTFAQ